MSPLSTLFGWAKRIGVILGAASAVCVAYVAVGLPVPVTQAAVDLKIKPVGEVLEIVRTTQGQILTDLASVQRQQLRTERFTLERSIEAASSGDKIQFQLRMSQITDEITRLDRRDAERGK